MLGKREKKLKKALRRVSKGFSLTAENFLLKCVTKSKLQRISYRKKKSTKKFKRRMIKMATREEHIKKINLELEKMSDEELESVAGGTIG